MLEQLVGRACLASADGAVIARSGNYDTPSQNASNTAHLVMLNDPNADLEFNASTLYLGQAVAGPGSGALTVKTGAVTDATLRFNGNYVLGNFSITSDGHGGTLLLDPPLPGPTLAGADGAARSARGGSACPRLTIAQPVNLREGNSRA